MACARLGAPRGGGALTEGRGKVCVAASSSGPSVKAIWN
jgi:hypothetical protein